MAITEHTNATMTPIKLISSLLDNARFLITHILTLGDAIKAKDRNGGRHLRSEETARSTHKAGNSLFCDIYGSDVKHQPFITYGVDSLARSLAGSEFVAMLVRT